jgi:hypothetical protein
MQKPKVIRVKIRRMAGMPPRRDQKDDPNRIIPIRPLK